jgi:hypothetical protein
MSDRISILLRRPVYEKLQKLAVLIGDESSAVERLIAHWESAAVQPSSALGKSEVQYWHSPTGDVLRVGEALQASDNGKIHRATVERDGIRYSGNLYDSPTAAARAVKHARGVRGSSASTNGRGFWRLRHPKTNRWVPIRELRSPVRVDGNALVAELDAHYSGGKATASGKI